MKKILLAILAILFFAYSASCSEKIESSSQTAPPVSGTVVNGYRILPIEKNAGKFDLKVYRGDYIKFKIYPSMPAPLLKIPDLSIEILTIPSQSLQQNK